MHEVYGRVRGVGGLGEAAGAVDRYGVTAPGVVGAVDHDLCAAERGLEPGPGGQVGAGASADRLDVVPAPASGTHHARPQVTEPARDDDAHLLTMAASGRL